MSVTKAIILAAGVGSRLRPLTNDRPKCLLEVGGRTLLERQLAALESAGVNDVVVVVGYQAAAIRESLGPHVRYVENDRYEATNSLFSLWLARKELVGGAVILNSDVLAAPQLYRQLLDTPDPDAILVEVGTTFEAEDMKVELRGRQIVDFSKVLPPARAHAHNVGMAKFSDGAERLVGCLDKLVAANHENDWAPAAYKAFASQWPLIAVPTNGLPWIEIDFVGDLRRARIEIEPAIARLERDLVRQ
ncbi:MAG: phosphocholine cytidylyltransferase family protein [Acidobacteria bacterium]|nr:phosphocholine cytidylyltransferase family protein [Acidobacteriota bacterium]